MIRKAGLIALGIGTAAWYIAARRDKRTIPSDHITDDVLRPDRGTTQQVGTNREQQQHRQPPPSKKSQQG
jgi:hypothetical protein